MIELIEKHRAELGDLCRRFHVKTLEVFGSAADGTWDPERSDLDFLVQFLPEAAVRSFWGYFDLKEQLEQVFGRKVDLVMPGAIRNRYFLEAVNQQRKVLYAAHNARTLLDDVRQAAQLVKDFTTARSLADYNADAMLHAAVERQFIIMGEALSRLEKLDASLASRITNHRQIIGFRNVLVHGYDSIDNQIVWGVIHKELPVLTQQVESILSNLGAP